MTGDERKMLRMLNRAYMAKAAAGKHIEAFEEPAYETAFIGVTTDLRPVYDYDKMIEDLKETERIGRKAAEDFINRHHALMNRVPIIVHTKEQ